MSLATAISSRFSQRSRSSEIIGFNVAAAEVDTHDDVKVATLGFAAVGFENAAVQGVLNQITEALRKHPIAEYLGSEQSVGHEIV